MLPGEAELVSEWTCLPGMWSVKRFERSNRLDTALYKKTTFTVEFYFQLVSLIRLESECPSLSRQNSAGASSSVAASSTPQREPVSAYLMPPVKLDDKERQIASLQILKLLCDAPLLQPHLLELLSARFVWIYRRICFACVVNRVFRNLESVQKNLLPSLPESCSRVMHLGLSVRTRYPKTIAPIDLIFWHMK